LIACAPFAGFFRASPDLPRISASESVKAIRAVFQSQDPASGLAAFVGVLGEMIVVQQQTGEVCRSGFLEKPEQHGRASGIIDHLDNAGRVRKLAFRDERVKPIRRHLKFAIE
jgi:hypothetical protein